ncbi:MAG: serine hydrolase domain-containing protein [Kordiimonas sp.]
MLAFLMALFSLAVFTLTSESAATVPSEAQIDIAVNTVMQRQGGVGSAVIVLKDGKPLFSKGYGFSNLEHKVPVSPETVFQVGSIGKMFTATGVMLLVEKGQLSLDAKLSDFFPNGPEFWNRVTIEHLLSHRSGIRSVTGQGGALQLDTSSGQMVAILQYLRELRNEYTEEQYLELIAKADMLFEPGTQYAYSNEGYVLIGMIIRQITGQFFGDFLAENIFSKLGMNTAQIDENSQIVANRAQSYEFFNGRLVHAPFISNFYNRTADGSLIFSLQDVAKWDAALHDGTLLKQNVLSRTFKGTAFPDGSVGPHNYGFGWWTGNVRGREFSAHRGSWQGFRSAIVRYHEDGLTLAVLTNTGFGHPIEIASAVAGLFNPAYAPYSALAEQESSIEVRDFTKIYLSGQAEQSAFNQEGLHLLDSAQVARSGKHIDVSESTVFELVYEHNMPEGRVVTYRITNDDEPRGPTVTYTYDVLGKISDILFQPRSF